MTKILCAKFCPILLHDEPTCTSSLRLARHDTSWPQSEQKFFQTGPRNHHCFAQTVVVSRPVRNLVQCCIFCVRSTSKTCTGIGVVPPTARQCLASFHVSESDQPSSPSASIRQTRHLGTPASFANTPCSITIFIIIHFFQQHKHSFFNRCCVDAFHVCFEFFKTCWNFRQYIQFSNVDSKEADIVSGRDKTRGLEGSVVPAASELFNAVEHYQSLSFFGLFEKLYLLLENHQKEQHM